MIFLELNRCSFWQLNSENDRPRLNWQTLDTNTFQDLTRVSQYVKSMPSQRRKSLLNTFVFHLYFLHDLEQLGQKFFHVAVLLPRILSYSHHTASSYIPFRICSYCHFCDIFSGTLFSIISTYIELLKSPFLLEWVPWILGHLTHLTRMDINNYRLRLWYQAAWIQILTHHLWAVWLRDRSSITLTFNFLTYNVDVVIVSRVVVRIK